MPTEKVTITVPGQGPIIVDVSIRGDEEDEVIAARLAKGFSVGTRFGIAGSRWQVFEGGRVGLATAGAPTVSKPSESGVMTAVVFPKPLDFVVLQLDKPIKVVAPEPEPREPLVIEKARDVYKPGEVWKPRDPRRKSGFTIKAVTDTEVIAEDGRTVQLDRMKRYERVG